MLTESEVSTKSQLRELAMSHIRLEKAFTRFLKRGDKRRAEEDSDTEDEHKHKDKKAKKKVDDTDSDSSDSDEEPSKSKKDKEKKKKKKKAAGKTRSGKTRISPFAPEALA
jgi:hypothetical protein